MWVLGLNAPPLGWHDAAACLVDEAGKVHAFVEEERISRRKHALGSWPARAAQACLDLVGLTPADIDVVAVGWELGRHSTRTDLARLDPPVLGRPWTFGDSAAFLRTALGWDLHDRRHPELVGVPHHYAHACAAFYASGLAEAAVVVVDGHGDDESVSIYDARHGRYLVRRERWPTTSSLGHMYNAVSELIGLSLLEAGKTMGLAAYGRERGVETWPVFSIGKDSFAPPFDLPPDATDQEIIVGWWDHFREAGFARRPCPPDELDRYEHAVRLAWSAQSSLQQVCGLLVDLARRRTGHHAVCLSGGVALNCSSNGLLPPPVYVPPVPHDAGVSLGAAWSIVPPRRPGPPLSPYLGRTIPDADLHAVLAREGLRIRPAGPDEVGDRLLAGQLAGMVVGQAEIGPRALCHRSVLASAGDAGMRDRLNRAKGREPWRPFGPVGLPEAEGAYWSADDRLHRYMIGASDVTPLGCDRAPAAVHVDGTARPQVVDDPDEPVREILGHLRQAGAPPVLINTSFNTRGEPIVDDADGAVRSARAIGLDFLVVRDGVVDLLPAGAR